MGRLNLGGWKLRSPLELNQCYLSRSVDLDEAEAPKISFQGSYLLFTNPYGLALLADRLTVGDDLLLRSKAQCTGEVGLAGAHIGGTLDCSGAVFTNRNGVALNAHELAVDAGMSLDKAQCTGEVRLGGAHIGGTLDCSEASRREVLDPAAPSSRS